MDAESDNFDLRRFLEHFRAALQAEDPGVTPELPQWVVRYGELCEQGNRRLRSCFNLIKRGQYTNAVAISEQDPNLLDWCTQLDIPESGILVRVAQILGVQAPTLLNRELVEALQEAYQKGSTAAENLRQLHRLVLARAPLPTRLAIMRRMLAQDPDHPYMDEDIRKLERAWFKQALPTVQSWVKQGRPELIQEVREDLEKSGYLETPPPSLISGLQAQVAKVQAEQLPTLAEAIRGAFAEQSIWTLTQLAERWRMMVAGAGRQGADLAYGVAEALDWLEWVQDQERRNEEKERVRSELSRLIRSPHARPSELEAAYETARGQGVLDAELEREYRSWFEGQERRRRSLLVGSVGAAAVIVGAGVLGAILAMRSSGPPESGPGADAAASPSVPPARSSRSAPVTTGPASGTIRT